MVTWINKPKSIEKYMGFVYRITNLETNMIYIGSKQFWFKKKHKVKGRIQRYYEESDWKTYYGSSQYLSSDIRKYGKHKFERVILGCYVTKWEILYYEAKEQFRLDVLLDPMYYNYWIRIKLRKKKWKTY